MDKSTETYRNLIFDKKKLTQEILKAEAKLERRDEEHKSGLIKKIERLNIELEAVKKEMENRKKEYKMEKVEEIEFEHAFDEALKSNPEYQSTIKILVGLNAQLTGKSTEEKREIRKTMTLVNKEINSIEEQIRDELLKEKEGRSK